MIGHRIMNSLTKSAVASLKLKESLYLWKSSTGEFFYDGGTMLQILVEKVNPTTRVGVVNLKDKIRNCKLANFGHNVRDMLDNIISLNDEIEERGFTHDDLVYDIFQALLSGNNEAFSSFVQRKKDDWDIGNDMTSDEIVTSAVQKYNNMVMQKTWKQTESKNAKIVALTTQVQNLEKKLNSGDYKKSSGGNSNHDNKKSSKLNVAEWRLTKTFGNSVVKDDKTWHWCSKQHNKGKGMYVTHKEEDHTPWQERKKNDQSKKSNSNNSQGGSNKSMTLSDNLKAAMVSKFKCTEDDAAKLWSNVVKANQEN
jgi:hypothetical protein